MLRKNTRADRTTAVERGVETAGRTLAWNHTTARKSSEQNAEHCPQQQKSRQGEKTKGLRETGFC